MNRLVSTVGLLSLVFLFGNLGCSSKSNDMDVSAMAPVAPPPEEAPQAPAAPAPEDGVGSEEAPDDGTSDDVAVGSDDGSEVMDDGTGSDVAGADDGSVGTDEDGSGQPAAPIIPKTLREQAEQAFNDGYERAAYRLIQAHLLSSSTDASEILSHYRWSTARRQPQLGARVAVGVALTSPPSEKQDFKPIGSLKGYFNKQKSTVSRRKAVNFDDTVDDTGSDEAATYMINDKERILQKYAGMMGDVLVEHFKLAHREGKLSPYFRSLSGVASTGSSAGFFDDGSDADSSSEDYSNGGMKSGRASLDTRIEGDEAKHTSVGPILMFVGVNTTNELIERAKNGQFDALVIYEVEITLNMQVRMIYNECRAKLINMADGKSLAVSKLLKNTEAQKEIDKTGKDYVVKAMQTVLSKLDETVALTELPTALTPEIIKTRRLSVLTSDLTRPKLESLAEIRLYREKSLLQDEDLITAFQTILGAEDGKLLATGTDEERLAVVKKLLAGS